MPIPAMSAAAKKIPSGMSGSDESEPVPVFGSAVTPDAELLA